jgi:hypothetical protein
MNIVKHENSFGDLMSIADAFAQSGLFSDIKSKAQAFVKIMAGQEIGIPPFQAMGGIHIIMGGKVTIGAGIMASKIKSSGKYDYLVVEHTDSLCSINILQDGKVIGNSTFTLDHAKKASTKNLDKFPRNMFFARAISNAVRWYAPDVFAGPVYVPEDFGEIGETQQNNEQLETGDALRGLSYCGNLADLKAWKEAVPAHVIAYPAVMAAAKLKHLEITQVTETI